MWTPLLAFIGSLLLSAAPLAAITLGQVDTFQDGTTQGWSEGVNSPNPPTNIATGGPAGAGDRNLQNISSGGFGAGSKMIMFNTAQWTGNYTAAGVIRIEADMANLGTTVLNMRITLEGSSIYSSSSAAVLPADGQWYHVAFNINAASLTLVSGPGPLSNLLSNVTELRLLSSASPSSNGDALVGTLGVDNITAVGDSDGDGVPDSIDQCPNTVPGASVDAVGCPPVIFGDLDRDGDVDLQDLTGFEACASGPGVPHNGTPTCAGLDSAADGDVDQVDFAIFQRCYSGENVPADPNCAN